MPACPVQFILHWRKLSFGCDAVQFGEVHRLLGKTNLQLPAACLLLAWLSLRPLRNVGEHLPGYTGWQIKHSILYSHWYENIKSCILLYCLQVLILVEFNNFLIWFTNYQQQPNVSKSILHEGLFIVIKEIYVFSVRFVHNSQINKGLHVQPLFITVL
jgi:hypothetical protein